MFDSLTHTCNLKKEQGAIAIFVLVALLFMIAFLILSYASNLNKSKKVAEQFNIIQQIYSYTGEEQGAYNKAYTDLRRKNKQLMTASVENNSILELNKTYAEKISNYRIYGNSVQNGTPSPDNPVEVQSVGERINLFNAVTGRTIKNAGAYSNNTQRSFSGNGIYVGMTTNNYNGPGNIDSYQIISNNEVELQLKQGGASAGYGIGFDFAVQPGEQYYVQHSDSNLIGYGLYTKDGTWLFNSDASNKTITIPNNCYWILLVLRPNPASGKVTYQNIQLEKSNVATEFVPYGKYRIPIKLTNENGESTTTNIYLDEPLRKVGNLSDYIDSESGKVIRNIKQVVFTGTETFGINVNNNVYTEAIYKGRLRRVLSSHFVSDDHWLSRQGDAYLLVEQSRIYFYIDKYTNEELSSWFLEQSSNGNPVIVYYVSQTSEEETIDLPKLSTYEDYTKIEVLTEIAPSKIEAEYTGYTLD